MRRKHQLSEDNPFRESPNKLHQVASAGSDTLFISRSNISKFTIQRVSATNNSASLSTSDSRVVVRRTREESPYEQEDDDDEEEDEEEDEFDADDKVLIASTDDEAETENTDFQDAKENTQSATESAKATPEPEPEPEVEEEDEDDETPLEVLEEMNKLEECFPVLSTNYRLLDKIGEGTFSTVFRAEALNGSVKMGSELWKSPPLKNYKPTVSTKRKKNPIVALKQIYVTSSPNRIHNELNLLYMLSGNSHVAALLDVLRHQDQVVAILPYYKHADFRDFYRDLPIKGIKKYMWELFRALSFVHEKAIIHRDLKPTNFLYDPFKGRGVLVDFGLAEKQPPLSNSNSYNSCPCFSKESSRIKKRMFKAAYPKQDLRPPRRANRAGTRGFRAPEVLFKCSNQLTKLDIWSAGVIALSILLRKFPLFNSPDDVDAIMELVLIFGIEKMTKCAEFHGCGLELQLTTQPERIGNGNLIQLIGDFLRYEAENDAIPSDSVLWDTLDLLNERGDKFVKPSEDGEDYTQKLENYKDHKHLVELLNACLHMDHRKRVTAKQALKLPFFKELAMSDDDHEIIL